MFIQTTYPEQFGFGFEGQLADSGSDRFIRIYTNSVADMSFGRAVVQLPADADNECSIPSAASQGLLGITTFTHAWERDLLSDSGDAGIAQNKPANVLRRGRVIVVVESAVTPASPVYYRHSNAGASPEAIARFRGDNDGGSGDVEQVTSGARFMTSASAGEKAILEISL